MIGRALAAAVLVAVLVLGALFFYDLGDVGLTDPGEPGYPSRCDDVDVG